MRGSVRTVGDQKNTAMMKLEPAATCHKMLRCCRNWDASGHYGSPSRRSEGRYCVMENRMQKGTMRRVMLASGFVGATLSGGAAMAADLSRPVYKAPPAGVLP